MHSHHSHSGQYCTHATGDLEECIQEAIRQKYTLFCLSEHIPRYRESDIYPGEDTTLLKLMDVFQAYHTHARQLQRQYADKIKIYVGLESEYIRAIDLRVLELLVAKYPIDYMVGSVHHVNSIPVDFDKAKWTEARESCESDADFYGRYFDHQYEVMQRFKPLVIGHFDVILLFAPEGTDLTSYPEVLEKIQRNINFVVGYGGMFELNSAAYRKGWDTAYPKPNILKLMKSAGGKFCLSDDSHGPPHIGHNYHRLQEYVVDMDLDLSHLEMEENEMIVKSIDRTNFLNWSARKD